MKAHILLVVLFGLVCSEHDDSQYLLKNEKTKGLMYSISPNTLSWIDAVKYCEYSGGILAEIMDEHEQKAVEMFLNQFDTAGAIGYWIGLTDLSHEGQWMWISSGKVAEYLNWGTGGEPNNKNGIEHFAHIHPAQRHWNDCPNIGGHPDHGTVCDLGFYGLCQYTL